MGGGFSYQLSDFEDTILEDIALKPNNDGICNGKSPTDHDCVDCGIFLLQSRAIASFFFI